MGLGGASASTDFRGVLYGSILAARSEQHSIRPCGQMPCKLPAIFLWLFPSCCRITNVTRSSFRLFMVGIFKSSTFTSNSSLHCFFHSWWIGQPRILLLLDWIVLQWRSGRGHRDRSSLSNIGHQYSGRERDKICRRPIRYRIGWGHLYWLCSSYYLPLHEQLNASLHRYWAEIPHTNIGSRFQIAEVMLCVDLFAWICWVPIN